MRKLSNHSDCASEILCEDTHNYKRIYLFPLVGCLDMNIYRIARNFRGRKFRES